MVTTEFALVNAGSEAFLVCVFSDCFLIVLLACGLNYPKGKCINLLTVSVSKKIGSNQIIPICLVPSIDVWKIVSS